MNKNIFEHPLSKMLLTLTISGVLVMGLSSCNIRFDIGGTTMSFDVSYSEDNYYVPNSLKYTLRDVNSQLGWVTSKTVGEQKMMIVPVQLKGEQAWTTTMLDNINKAFFGETEETKYESVKSYFEKSSYGQLSFSGNVLSAHVSNYSKSEIESKGEEGVGWIIDEFYRSVSNATLKSYDKDGDGFIDNAVFIYSNTYSKSSSSSFWAWCFSHSTSPIITKPSINNYMWASYWFTQDKYIDGYRQEFKDAHTYIHETGHLLGLDDYYSYDTNGWDCAGKLEMQSYNVGDHNIFSKLAMGWVKPYVPTGSTTIELKTSSKYPEAILINDKWNGSAFSEYIIIEYYTPSELNEMDAEHNFSGNGKMYDYKGLRIYHVDARIAKLKAVNGNAVFQDYATTIPNSFDGYYYYVGASNSNCYSYLNAKDAVRYKLLHLIDQGGTNTASNTNHNISMNKTALWTGTKTFTPTSDYFINGDQTFNNGSHIGYAINVSDLTDESCKVTIAKI